VTASANENASASGHVNASVNEIEIVRASACVCAHVSASGNDARAGVSASSYVRENDYDALAVARSANCDASDALAQKWGDSLA